MLNILVYNGIRLDLVKLHVWSRENVYNSNQYLYTRHVLAVTAELNPALSGYVRSGDQQDVNLGPYANGANLSSQLDPTNTIAPPNANNTILGIPKLKIGNGVPGAITDASIRHALMQPHQQLVYAVHGYPTLYAPWPGYTCDASGGPLPLHCDVVSIKGSKAYRINYVIQTDVNECPLYDVENPVWISHTWTMTHTIDQDCFTIRAIQGRVVFGRDQLDSENIESDSFRAQFLHPLPDNFKRIQIIAKLLPDGCTMDYIVIDKEQALNLNLPNVTRVEGLHTINMGFAGAAGATGGIKDVISGVIDIVKKNLAGGIAQIVGGATSIGEAALPQLTHDVIIRLWGNRNTNRASLSLSAINLLGNRLNILTGAGEFTSAALPTFLAGFNFRLTHDIAGKFVEVQMTTLGSPIPALALAAFVANQPGVIGNPLLLANAVPGLGAAAQLLFANDDTGLIIQDKSWDGRQGYPPTNQNDRGTYLEEVMSQILLDPCQIPPDQTSITDSPYTGGGVGGGGGAILIPVPPPPRNSNFTSTRNR